MALEDICSFKDSAVQHKWSPCTTLDDIETPFHMPNYYDLGWRRPKTSGIPLDIFLPPIPNRIHHSRALSTFPPANRSVTVRRPFPLCHGTTTLGFIFQGGIIAAADTRASAGGLVASPTVNKITPIHSHLVVTSSGSGADCMLWERILTREIRLYQLRHKRRLTISGTAKLLSFMLHPFKGTELCVALTLCGWDQELAHIANTNSAPAVNTDFTTMTHSVSTRGGPRLIYVCSDGARLQGDIFSVGSGSPFAYGILDGELRWSLSEEEAVSLGREAVFRATHRDAYSGNNVDLFKVTAQGWSQRKREDLKEEYYKEMDKRAKMVEERKKATK